MYHPQRYLKKNNGHTKHKSESEELVPYNSAQASLTQVCVCWVKHNVGYIVVPVHLIMLHLQDQFMLVVIVDPR